MSLIALKRGAAEMRLPFAVSQDYFFDSLCASSLIGCVEDVSYLVLHHSFDGVSGRSQILSRIEVLRMFGEMFSDLSCHSQSQIRIDVDLAYSVLGRSPYPVSYTHLDVYKRQLTMC